MDNETLFFSKIVTKNLQFKKTDDGRRLFKGYLTVEMVDKQNEITIRDELAKVVPIWINRGGPISDNHSNRIVGRGLEWEKTDVYDEKSNRSYPAIMILGEIFKNYQLDDFIWEAIKRGEYRGLSFGGSTKSNRVPTMQDNGKVAYALKDLEQYEVAVCFLPGTKILMGNNKHKNIEDIKIGDTVIGHDGKPHKVTDTMERNYDGWIHKVSTSFRNPEKTKYKTPHNPLLVTPEHPIMLEDGSFKPVKDLTKKDRVRTATVAWNKGKHGYIDGDKSRYQTKYDSPQRIKENERIEREREEFEKQGFKFIRISGHTIPDAVAIKDGKVLAVEVEYQGRPNYEKYLKVTHDYDDVVWIRRSDNEFKNTVRMGSSRLNCVGKRSGFDYKGKVYNLEVKDVHTYVANGIVVHNCREPAVPLALIVEHNHLAKSAADSYHMREDGKAVIRCTNVGCFVEKRVGAFYEGTHGRRGRAIYDGEKDDTPNQQTSEDTKKYQDTFDTYDDEDAIKDENKKSEEWSGIDGVNRPQKDDKKIDYQEAEVTSGNQNDATGMDQTYRGTSKANTEGSYPSTGETYSTAAKDDEKAIKEKSENILKEMDDMKPSKQKPDRAAFVDDVYATGTGKVSPSRVADTNGKQPGVSDLGMTTGRGNVPTLNTSLARQLKSLVEEAKGRMDVAQGIHSCDSYHGDNRSDVTVGPKDDKTMDKDDKDLPIEKDDEPGESKQKPGANALHDEYEGMLSGKIPQSRMAGSGPTGIKQVKPENLTSLKSDYSMNGIVEDPSEEDKDLKEKYQAPTGYVDKPKEERESRRNTVDKMLDYLSKPMGQYANFEECLKDGNSEAYCGEIYHRTHDKKKWNSAPSLQANNGEDGPNKPRADDDKEAEAFKKSDIYLVGGTKGSFETAEQGPGQSAQTRSVNGREEETKDKEKDPYNTINTSVDKIYNSILNIKATKILKKLQ